MEGIYKYGDCIINQVSYSFQVGQSPNFGNCLNIALMGTGTPENTIAPNEQDGFTVAIPLPENILTIGDGLPAYIENELQQYRID